MYVHILADIDKEAPLRRQSSSNETPTWGRKRDTLSEVGHSGQQAGSSQGNPAVRERGPHSEVARRGGGRRGPSWQPESGRRPGAPPRRVGPANRPPSKQLAPPAGPSTPTSSSPSRGRCRRLHAPAPPTKVGLQSRAVVSRELEGWPFHGGPAGDRAGTNCHWLPPPAVRRPRGPREGGDAPAPREGGDALAPAQPACWRAAAAEAAAGVGGEHGAVARYGHGGCWCARGEEAR
mmetsp:Transcript_64653/g.173211  ORF Transcript_64653/g.173211 Transcript_64653/m.173211 type:complete len:235 (+) Transcript_64653:60-764(+)